MTEDEYLATSGWSAAHKTPLGGDASSRRYTRLDRDGNSAILMDAGVAAGAEIQRFVDIAKHLSGLGLSAPEILAAPTDRFLLLEDLGDAVFACIMADEPALETTLYKAALDALIVSQSTPAPDFLNAYGPREMADAIGPVFEWYPTKNHPYPAVETAHIMQQFETVLTEHLTAKPVLIQRDFHAENLIWLPNRKGAARAGLLDFQDAVTGDPAYDVASLLIDARREVSPQMRADLIAYYVSETGVDAAAFQAAFAVCSAQRNLRILGIFAALAQRDGKTSYLSLIPRVWRNLTGDLSHPVLHDLRDDLLRILPEPENV